MLTNMLLLAVLIIVSPFALVMGVVGTLFLYGMLRGLVRAMYDHWREWRAERARRQALADEYTSFLKPSLS